MTFSEFITWLGQSWIVVVAVIGGITIVWNFTHRTVKEITEAVVKPLDDIKAEVSEIKADSKLTTSALLSMQRKSLLESFDFYLKQGYIPVRERETLAKQYESYCALGGNSFIHDMYEKVDALPVSDPDSEN